MLEEELSNQKQMKNRVGGITWSKPSNAHFNNQSDQFDKFEQFANKSVGDQSIEQAEFTDQIKELLNQNREF